MHHRLFVAAKIIREVRILLQSLAYSRNVTMPEDTEASGKEILFMSVARHALRAEVSNDGLCGSQFLRHAYPLVRDATFEKRTAAEYSI